MKIGQYVQNVTEGKYKIIFYYKQNKKKGI